MRGLFARTLPVKCRLLFDPGDLGPLVLLVGDMVDVADRTSVRMSREAGLIDVRSFDLASKDIEYASFSLSFCPSLSLVMADEAERLRKARGRRRSFGGPSGAQRR